MAPTCVMLTSFVLRRLPVDTIVDAVTDVAFKQASEALFASGYAKALKSHERALIKNAFKALEDRIDIDGAELIKEKLRGL